MKPQVGVKIKNVWNHLVDKIYKSEYVTNVPSPRIHQP